MVPHRLGRLALGAPQTPGQTGGNRCKEVGVRVREVMSIPVVCVPPDAPLKNVARVLVTHGISGPSDPVDRRLAALLARGVPGVLEVRLDEE
jgi:CBS domain-containing protein